MDENEIIENAMELTPRLHSRWSVLVLAASWAQQVSAATADVLTGAMQITIEHASQKNYDREFKRIVED